MRRSRYRWAFRSFSLLFDGGRTQVEDMLELFGDLAVGHIDIRLAVGFDKDAQGFGHADGVGELYEHFIAYACGYQVFGDVPAA